MPLCPAIIGELPKKSLPPGRTSAVVTPSQRATPKCSLAGCIALHAGNVGDRLQRRLNYRSPIQTERISTLKIDSTFDESHRAAGVRAQRMAAPDSDVPILSNLQAARPPVDPKLNRGVD